MTHLPRLMSPCPSPCPHDPNTPTSSIDSLRTPFSPSPSLSDTSSPMQLTALIVDDMITNRKLMEKTLKTSTDYKLCDQAGNLEDAWKLLNTKTYDLIFMDNQIPPSQKTGLEILIEFRELKEGSQTEASKTNQLAKIFLWTSDQPNDSSLPDDKQHFNTNILAKYKISYLQKGGSDKKEILKALTK